MENVVKQGFLKKGNSTEGGVFSGIIEKITPRKWYVLIVRNRVPYMEQYERDVDVFSCAPTVAYNLSTCTSVCRTMSSTARTFSFVIVCPDELIELIAASREQMVDWCNTIERTLAILGFLKREQEEHIYTFCPAVVNSVGRSQVGKTDDPDDPSLSDEELGAVGGTPALASPPPRFQAPLPPVPNSLPPPLHPVPNSHPPPLPRMLSEPASHRSSPPSPPTFHPPRSEGARSASPSETTTIPSSAPPSPHVSVPLSTPATSSHPPPLPRGRLPNSPVRASVKPPPLPAGRPSVAGVQERSLPPVPPPSPPVCGSRAEAAGAGSNSEEEESDYSSDFVSGAFWEINRKTPIPSARHAVLPPKPAVPDPSLPSAGATSGGGGGAKCGTAGGESCEELDEGYTDLSNWKPSEPSEDRRDQRDRDSQDHGRDKDSKEPGPDQKNEYTKVRKRPCELKRDAEDSQGPSVPSASPSHPPPPENGHHRPDSEAVCSPARSHNDLSTGDGSENFYAPFPGESEDSSMTSSRQSDSCDPDDLGVGVSVVRITSSPSPTDAPPLPEDDCMYASACEASTLFPSDPGPPLPPRQDSLSAWRVEGGGESGAAACSEGVVSLPCGATPDSSPTHRPTPRRRTLHTSSHPLTKVELSHSQGSLLVADMPPLPPPRRGVPLMCQSMMEGVTGQHPPPLPTRRTHSVHGNRPVSLIATSSMSSSVVETDDSFPTDMSQSFCGATSLTRQQSFGNGDLSGGENLRQRMRLERGHSVSISLKQSQADILRQEMDLPGVTVTVTLRAAVGIALVDCDQAVVIAGWNQRDFPSLHGKLHIGDQLISVCNVRVTSAAMALKMLKHPTADLVEMLVRRTPHAQVMAIRRLAEGQNIGIKRQGGTAEILYVDPNGLAAANGLALHAPGVLGEGRTNWVLTEINSRHLNLFFKDNEIEHRLNAVGREITIVVQPSDYITELKRQLKKMKNYKNYIVQ